MNLRRIRYFLSVSETLNFSESARAFGISQPALTKAIRKLEAETGGALIRREGRHTHLTQLGRLMLDHFLPIEAAARKAENASSQFARRNGQQIHLAVMCTIGPQRVVPFLNAFQTDMPQVEVILHDANRETVMQMLLSGAVDCALTVQPTEEEPRIRLSPLYQEPMVLGCSVQNPLASRDAVTLSEVMAEPYLDRLNCEFRNFFMDQSQQLGLEVMFAARSEREDWIQALVAADAGVTILAETSIVQDQIIPVPLSGGEFHRSVFLASARGREDTPLLRDFLSTARRFDWEQNVSGSG